MNDRGGGVVVVIAAMPRELRPIVRALQLRAGSVGGVPAWLGGGVVAVAVGVGPARAGAGSAKVLGALLATRVLVTGVAGAVDPSLGVGAVILPAHVVDVRTGARFAPSTSARRKGVLASVEGVFASPGNPPGALGGSCPLPEGTVAVDMETAAVAAVAERMGLPWDVVRAVSDTAGTLTPQLAGILRPDGRADMRAAARLVLGDPRAARRLARLGRGAARATRAASDVVLRQLEELGLPDPGKG